MYGACRVLRLLRASSSSSSSVYRISSSSSSSYSAPAGAPQPDLCSEHVRHGDSAAQEHKSKEKITELLRGPWSPSKEKSLSAFLPISSSTLREVLKTLAQSRQQAAEEEEEEEDCGLRFLSWAAQAQQPSPIGSEDMEVIGKTWAESYGADKVSEMHHRILASCPDAIAEPAWAALIVSFTKLGRPAMAVSLFADMKRVGNCEPTSLSYEALLFALLRCGRCDAAMAVAREEMLPARLLPGIKPLGALLDALCREGKAEAAMALVREIEKLLHHFSSTPADLLRHLYSRFITAVWRIPARSYMAIEILCEMKAKGLKPNRHAHTACVKLLCRNNRFGMAQELVKEAGMEDCDVDMPTYVALIQGLNRGGKAKEALTIAELLMKKKKKRQQNGPPLGSTLCTAILNSLFLAGKASDAVGIFEQMRKEGDDDAADASMYMVMIKGLCQAGGVKQALAMKEEMIGRGFKADARLYLTLCHGLCMGSAHIEELLQVVEEMRSKGYSLPAEVYFTLVTHFCTIGRFNLAKVWAEEMRNHGHEPTPYLRTTFLSKLNDVSCC